MVVRVQEIKQTRLARRIQSINFMGDTRDISFPQPMDNDRSQLGLHTDRISLRNALHAIVLSQAFIISHIIYAPHYLSIQ